MFRVIIPTYNRHHFLATTLRSIQAQTVLKEIDLIVVSENGDSDFSRAVCADFPDLPIRYQRTNSKYSVTEHFVKLVTEETSAPYTALLHDDDWWGPDHLENAKNAFEQFPNSTGFFSSIFKVFAESSLLDCEANEATWFGAKFPTLAPVWELNSLEMTAASLGRTPFHYSTMVAKSSALAACDSIDFLDNLFDSDRMLPLILVKSGSILYRPIPDTFIRQHEDQDLRRFSRKNVIEICKKTNLWIMDQCQDEKMALAKHLASCWTACPKYARPRLHEIFNREYCRDQFVEFAELVPELKYLLLQKKLRRTLKNFVPPILMPFLERIYFSFFRR